MEAEHHIVELVAHPVSWFCTIVPVIGRIDRVHQIAIYPHMQGVIRLVKQVSRFHAVPGIGCQLGTAPPLIHFGCNIVATEFIGAENTFDLAYADFIVSVQAAFGTENMFMVIASDIAQRHTHIDVGAGVQALGTSRYGAYDLGRGCGAFKVDGFGTAVGFAAINQGVLRTGQGVAVVRYPADKVLPTSRLGVNSTAFKVIAEQDTGTVVNGRGGRGA